MVKYPLNRREYLIRHFVERPLPTTINPRAFLGSHGTFLSSIRPMFDVDPHRPIVCVALPLPQLGRLACPRHVGRVVILITLTMPCCGFIAAVATLHFVKHLLHLLHLKLFMGH